MSFRNIGAFVLLLLALNLISACIDDQVAPPLIEPEMPSIVISPTTATLPTGGTQDFKATLTGSGNADVIWNVQEGAAGGTILEKPNEEGDAEDTANAKIGRYIAPTAAGIFNIVVTSQVDPTISATATVTVSSSLDADFGTNGKVQSGFGGNDRVNAIALQSDGKILSAGFSLNGTKNEFALARYNTDGTLDTTLGANGSVTTSIGKGSEGNALAIQTDGKIVVGGFSFDGVTNNFTVVRYSKNGGLDTTFGSNGTVTTPITNGGIIKALAIQSDNKIVAGGFSEGFESAFTLVRYKPNGTVDTVFGTNGIVKTEFTTNPSNESELNALVIQSDGKIVAGGFFEGSGNDFALARYETNGTLDTSFGTEGKVTTSFGINADEIKTLVIDSNNKIVVGGFSFNGTNNDFALARYNTDGSLDGTFGTAGKVTTPIGSGADEIKALVIDSNNKIVVGGFFTLSATDNDFSLARYDTDGSLDTTFGTGGIVKKPIVASSVEELNGLAIQSDGKIVAGGFSSTSLRSDFVLVRYEPTGALDSTFDSDGKVTSSIGGGNDEINAVAIQSDSNIIAAGYAFGVNGNLNDDFALARYKTDGSLDTTFDSDGKVTTSIGSSHDRIHAIAIEARFFEGTVSVSTGSMSVTGNNTQFTQDLKVGDAITILKDPTNPATVLVISSDTALTLSDPYMGVSDPNTTIQRHKIVVAGFSFNSTDNVNDFALARYDINGTPDPGFGTSGIVKTEIDSVSNKNDEINSLAIDSNDKVIAAGVSFTGGNNVFALARYNNDGNLDATFDGNGKVTTQIGAGSSFAKGIAIYPIVGQPTDGKILVAGVSSNGSDLDFTLVRYEPNGGIDTNFGTNGIVMTPIGTGHDIANAIAIQSDDKIIVAGGSLTGDTAGLFVLVRYNADGSLDTSFGSAGIVTTLIGAEENNDSQVTALSIQSDGKILAGGYIFNAENNRDFALVRYNPDGSLDTTFGVGGIEISPFSSGIDEIHAITTNLSEDRIIAAGVVFNSNNTNADFIVARYKTEPN